MANDGSKMTNPWFEHDENASNDGKILKMFRLLFLYLKLLY